MPRPLQWEQHVVARVTPVTRSILATLETLATLAWQERQVAQPVALCRSSGQPTQQGHVEMQHPGPEMRVRRRYSGILFQEPQWAGRPGAGLEVVCGEGLQAVGPEV